MAVNQITPVMKKQTNKGSSGGGGLGSLIGAGLGAAAILSGPGAVAAPALMGAMSTGAGLGGLLGGTLKPGQAPQMQQQNAQIPMVRSQNTQALMASADALKQMPMDVRQEYTPAIAAAMMQSLGQDMSTRRA